MRASDSLLHDLPPGPSLGCGLNTPGSAPSLRLHPILSTCCLQTDSQFSIESEKERQLRACSGTTFNMNNAAPGAEKLVGNAMGAPPMPSCTNFSSAWHPAVDYAERIRVGLTGRTAVRRSSSVLLAGST